MGMTVKELKEHILKNMSAEQALEKLLESSLIQYQHLKFDKGKEVHPVIVITMASLEMGWQMAIPNENDDEEISGMIIGTEEYIKSVLGEPHKCCCDENNCSNS